VRYEWPAFDGRMYVGGDVSYSDEYFYNLRNFDADKFDSYTMVNARIGWISGSDRLEAALKMENVTDERAGIQGFDIATLCGCNEISFQPPRWYGLNLRYSF
jgi:iron complex outermembrane receptor protein